MVVRGIEVVCGLCLPGEESGPSMFATAVVSEARLPLVSLFLISLLPLGFPGDF